MSISPRIAYNEKLYKEFLSSHKITARYPDVTKQLDGVLVNRKAISPYGYNPSIIRHDGRLLMAYRWHPKNNGQTALAMAVLDDDLNVVNNQGITVPDNHGSVEDPRLFIYAGELWMSYVDSTWPTMPPKCVVKYGRVMGAPWKVEGNYQVEYGHNDFTGLCKNWVFFEHGNRLLCIYQCSPEQVVLEVSGSKVLGEVRCEGAKWPWGQPRGGTVPLPFHIGLLRFFHSGLDNELAPYRRRYYVGAMVLEAEPPFKPIEVSSSPVLRGSEDCALTDLERRNCAHYKPQVVFPGGAVLTEDGWLLACGANDSQSVILRVKHENLNL